MSDLETLRTAVADAFASVGHMATKWALVAEIIDKDGDRCAWALTPDGQQAWDSLGLLMYGLQMEQAGAVIDAQDEA